jgi:hypothetical protein
MYKFFNLGLKKKHVVKAYKFIFLLKKKSNHNIPQVK